MAQITFPKEIVWAFNPNYIEISDASGYTSAEVTVGGKTLTVALYGGQAKVYISRLLQIAFINPQITRGKRVDLMVTVGTQTETSQTYVIWGNLAIGDRCAQFGAYDRGNGYLIRTVQWFVNYPFSINLLLTKGTIRRRKDGGSYGTPVSVSVTELATEQHMSGVNREYIIRHDPEGARDRGSFDDSFDYTFHFPDDTVTITRAIVRNEKEGCYLRWIDHFGFVQYYLFTKGDKTLQSTISSKSIESFEELNGLVFMGNTRPMSMTVAPSLKICAVGLDKETLDYVQTIVNSPIVDLYIGRSKDGVDYWQPVNVSGGSYTVNEHHRTVLQDFEITLSLPSQNSQQL